MIGGSVRTPGLVARAFVSVLADALVQLPGAKCMASTLFMEQSCFGDALVASGT
jgi:hypothetical protein